MFAMGYAQVLVALEEGLSFLAPARYDRYRKRAKKNQPFDWVSAEASSVPLRGCESKPLKPCSMVSQVMRAEVRMSPYLFQSCSSFFGFPRPPGLLKLLRNNTTTTRRTYGLSVSLC